MGQPKKGCNAVHEELRKICSQYRKYNHTQLTLEHIGGGVGGTHPPQVKNRSALHIRGPSSTDSTYCSNYYWKKSTYKWTCIIQTRVVQGSNVPYDASYGNLVYAYICTLTYVKSGMIHTKK